MSVLPTPSLRAFKQAGNRVLPPSKCGFAFLLSLGSVRWLPGLWAVGGIDHVRVALGG